MKKSFLRALSVAVVMLLIAGSVMIPTLAAVPETGIPVTSNSGASSQTVQNTIYRASDAAEATDGAWISSDNSVWKFAVGTLGDTFKPSATDFEAPVINPIGRDELEISWTAPADGKATVKVIADGYNKEIVTAANSITLNDAEIDKVYQVQVTVGDKSSKITSYNHIYAPTYATNSVFKEKTNVSSNEKRTYDYVFVNLEDYADLINSKSGFMVKINSNIVDDSYKVTSYYDNHTGVKTDVSCDAENAAMEPMSMSDNDVSIAFHTILQMPIRDDVGGMNAGAAITPNADATKKSKYFDIHNGLLREGRGTSYVTHTDDMKYQGFKEGYIFIPFDLLDDASKATVSEQGVINLDITRHRFYAKNLFENNNTWNWNILNWYETNYGDETKSGEITYWFDREISLSEIAFISDYDAFFNTCVDTDNLSAGIDYSKLTNTAETKGTVYLNTLADTTLTNEAKQSVAAKLLSDENVVSTYTASNIEYITYTTAAGEKMKLGFTAPAAGLYELSCPISVADYANKGVYTRVIKESADGTKTVIQPEAAYNGEKHLALLTEMLEAGDTVWFEAWANSAATVLNLGIPQMINMHRTPTATGTQYYSWFTNLRNVYTAERASLKINGALSYGYFINNMEVDGVVYDHVYAPTYDNATSVNHDTLGIANLAAVDDENTEADETDATALYNALTPHEVSRGSVLKSKYDMYRYRSEGTSFGMDGPTSGWNVSGMSITGTRQVRVSYGMGTAFGGGLNNVYFNAGVYMQFTAPSDGTIKELSPGGTEIGTNIVLHNNKVIAIRKSGTSDSLNVKNFEVKKGDTITVCYGTTDGTNTFYTNSSNKELRYRDIYDPRLSFDPAEEETASVSYDEAIDSILPAAYTVGDKITLPFVAKDGAIFEGWNDGTTLYAPGSEYTVTADTEFFAQYAYYGDLDGMDGVAQANDISIMRKMIMKHNETGAYEKADITADMDANGAIDLTDLVKIKKLSVGLDVTVGAK